MWISRCSSTTLTWTSNSAPVRMCRTVLLMTLVSVNVLYASSQVTTKRVPVLGKCREIYRAKGEVGEHIFAPEGIDVSCGRTVSFPIPNGQTINLTDIRHCKNYFNCTRYACDQCPCGEGETFNPVTLKCDSSNAQCECEGSTTTPSSTTVNTTGVVPEVTKNTVIIAQDSGDGLGQEGGDDSNKKDKSPVSTEVIIIAGIVSATVIVIVVIVMAVFCWQRRQTQHNIRMSKPAPPKLSAHSAHEGYSSSIPPSEKHVYAEIDERMVNGTGRHWQHGNGLSTAPPLPDHQPPPTSPTFTTSCPHHQHNRSDSGVGSGVGFSDTSFITNNHHRRTFQPIHPAHSNVIGEAYNERQPESHCCSDELYLGREDSSVSADSQYSHSSNPTSVDSHDIDMKNLIHAHHSKQNYMSKQVYI